MFYFLGPIAGAITHVQFAHARTLSFLTNHIKTTKVGLIVVLTYCSEVDSGALTKRWVFYYAHKLTQHGLEDW